MSSRTWLTGSGNGRRGWTAPPTSRPCGGSHDIFDAVIAALTARAAALGQVLQPAADDLATAAAEGWILIPTKPISALL
jgi:Protein of unknown function (DUF429)